MTTITANRPTHPHHTPEMATLRRVFRLDVALCATSGVVLVAAAGALADLVDMDGGGPIAAAGSFLMVLAGALAWLAQARAKTVLALSVPSAAGDLAWSAGSVMVAATVTMNGLGQVLVLAQAAAITCMAVAKLTARRAAARGIIGA
ncbi:MAG TPA: hypothetical protein VIR58_09380 [Acidimicrobiales bacterium]